MSRLRLAVLVTLTMAAASCGAENPAGPGEVGCGVAVTSPSCLVGTYVLTQVNGQVLPATVDSTHQLTGAMMSLTNDGTFAGTIASREVNNGAVVSQRTDPISGTYTVTGATTLSLTVQGNAPTTATVTDTTLTFAAGGFTFTFRKQ